MPFLQVRLVAGRGLASAVIRRAQLGFPLTHADAVFPDGYLGAHVSGGVHIRPVSYDAGAITAERFFSLKVTAAQASAFEAFLRDQVGKPYDRRAIVDFVLAAIGVPLRVAPLGAWQAPDRWECAELILAALVQAGVFNGALFDDARHVTPQSLATVLATLVCALGRENLDFLQKSPTAAISALDRSLFSMNASLAWSTVPSSTIIRPLHSPPGLIFSRNDAATASAKSSATTTQQPRCGSPSSRSRSANDSQNQRSTFASGVARRLLAFA